MAHAGGVQSVPTHPTVVVTGVSGAGKSTVGRALAARLGTVFTDADDLHSRDNVETMASGSPLTDEDRWPWLRRVAAAAGYSGVIACSALRRSYRDRLRAESTRALVFVELDAPRDALAARLGRRAGHFMPPTLLDSQLATLERLAPDEPGVVVDATLTPEEIVDAIVAWLAEATS